MNPRKQRRLAFVAALVAVGAIVAGRDHLRPGAEHHVFLQPHRRGRQHGSSRRGVPHRRAGGKRQLSHGAGAEVRFAVTDGKSTVPVEYQWRAAGPVPRRPGRGRDWARSTAAGTFEATEVLAKHDEKYMPPEVVRGAEASGRWKEGERQ